MKKKQLIKETIPNDCYCWTLYKRMQVVGKHMPENPLYLTVNYIMECEVDPSSMWGLDVKDKRLISEYMECLDSDESVFLDDFLDCLLDNVENDYNTHAKDYGSPPRD